MNCQEFWNQVPENSRPPGVGFAAHLSECRACASDWARQQNVVAGLRQVAAEWSCMEAPARIEARLVDAFRAQGGLARVRRPRPWIGAFTWATAAAAVLALAFSLVRVREPQTALPKAVPANALILAALQETPEGAGGSESAGLEAGFVPLPNVEQLAPNEQGDLVTVEVPRSAMIALGFEVSPERAAEPVQAEVMFGPDGVARAVRFLDETF
jgi:hypothetical protein